MRTSRSTLVLLASLLAAGSSAVLLNCAAPSEGEEEEALSEDQITGVNNALGLGLTYDKETGKVRATLRTPLKDGEKLFIRVRRGTITHESQARLDCSELAEAPPVTKGGADIATGKAIYDGPSVSQELIDLMSLYNDPRWYGGGETSEMQAEADKGPDSIVEACVTKSGKVRAKLLTHLAYAWDRGEDLKRQAAAGSRGVRFLNADAGEGEGGAEDPNPGGGGTILPEGPAYNTIDYARLCVQELGEIPFFKKIADGKYETFDCRDFVGSNEGGEAAPIEGVEGALISLTVDDQPRTECDEGRSSSRTYDCVDKCDRAMWLTASSHTGLGRKAACQPGPTVTTARNDKGTNWILLCRKVQADNGDSMMRTKKFNDIAIIGNNPETGATCFFQNKENIGNDGSRVTHPADVARSGAIWPGEPSSYCTKNCHAADAFVHSPWIDTARRADGTPIVPMMGKHRDYPISHNEMPYRLVNGPAQGFVVPQQQVGENVAVCASCHRVAGAAFAEFAEWSIGEGDAYMNKITDSYKQFEKSHYMPIRLDGLNAENFPTSRWGLAVKAIRTCTDNPRAEGCEFADIPSGR